ncbi:hypothetical protein CH365_11020 [Leptospira neocaledonica]|uniref:Uncharacterized protein n=1 Tax=Leptospira neocaledonica TaxID=2023192 RepID=A0A2M9ZYW4_9LEPT|nr:hypothetical protein CH365_11020 [Leptospira neocaledonica]
MKITPALHWDWGEWPVGDHISRITKSRLRQPNTIFKIRVGIPTSQVLSAFVFLCKKLHKFIA